ncbi:MAG TPA: hypothetical protein ENH40_05290 [Nitrospirae bacterium]|nr:hypothetical protein [Nitrospirota bacterium]
MESLFNRELFNPGDEAITMDYYANLFNEQFTGKVKEFNKADSMVVLDTVDCGEVIVHGKCLRVTHRAGIVIKALSLWQPWASLMAHDLKHNETRSWSTDYRGYLAIHASKKIVTDVDKECLAAIEKLGLTIEDLPTGGILAVRKLINCVKITPGNIPDEPERSYGDYTAGRYMWKTKDVKLLKGIVPVPGRQKLFNIDSDIINAIESHGRELF